MKTILPFARRRLASGVAAVAVAAVLLAPAAAAETKVFRCPDGKGRVLYTDTPCRGAEVVEINAGRAAPEASKRLAAAQAQLDAGMAEWRAVDAAAAAQRAAYVPQIAPAAADAPPPDWIYDGIGYWPGAYLPRERRDFDKRPRPTPHVEPARSVVPVSPRNPRTGAPLQR